MCTENELVISTWSPIHLRTKLKELYWKDGRTTAGAAAFFEDTLRYLYMPRFKSRDVLGQAIRSGASSRDFFGTAYGQSGEGFDGFQLGTSNVIFDDTLLLIEPVAAAAYEEAHRAAEPPPVTTSGGATGVSDVSQETGPTPPPGTGGAAPAKPRSFYATASVSPVTAKMRLVELAEEIVSVLTSDPNASVRLVVEISADFPEGASESMKRAVSENARSLGITKAAWE